MSPSAVTLYFSVSGQSVLRPMTGSTQLSSASTCGPPCLILSLVSALADLAFDHHADVEVVEDLAEIHVRRCLDTLDRDVAIEGEKPQIRRELVLPLLGDQLFRGQRRRGRRAAEVGGRRKPSSVLVRAATPSAHLGGSAKIVFQSSFMLITTQPRCFASSMSACVNVPTRVSGRPFAGP
jgi:hypothetical protein